MRQDALHGKEAGFTKLAYRKHVFRGITLGYSQSLPLFRWEEILSEVVHTAQVTTGWTSVPAGQAEGWVEATRESAELSSGRWRDTKGSGSGACLNNHGSSQRKQMNKAADGKVKCLDHLHPWRYLQTLYGELGAQAREAGGTGRDPEKAQTKFKRTAYISMDFWGWVSG